MPIILALIATLVDILSGFLILNSRVSKIDIRYIVGFASGVVISASFFELIPESNIAENAHYLALGFFAFYLIEKIVMLHSCGEGECESHNIGWIAAFGMASDNIVDGVGIAVGYMTDPALGVMIAVAVIAHEIPQGITTAMLMRNSGFNMPEVFGVLAIAGAMYPIGALLSNSVPQGFYEAIIAFVAGSFLYIGAGDLLSEAHRRFNAKVVVSVLLGALLPLVFELLAK